MVHLYLNCSMSSDDKVLKHAIVEVLEDDLMVLLTTVCPFSRRKGLKLPCVGL